MAPRWPIASPWACRSPASPSAPRSPAPSSPAGGPIPPPSPPLGNWPTACAAEPSKGSDMSAPLLSLLPVFASGFALWTLAEYLLHRFAMHEMGGKGMMSREHLEHHVES